MTDYTKGEWQRIRSGNDYAVAAKSEQFYPDDSLHMRGVARGIGNCDDAQLIAASPLLYEALKEAQDMLATIAKLNRVIDNDGDFEILQRHIKQALAKAEGAK